MATPRKLDNDKWMIQVFSHVENGKRKYVRFYGATKAEAQRKASEFQENKNSEDTPQTMTIQKCLINYIESKSNILSPKTYREYIRNVLGEKPKYKSIENIMVGSITSSDLQKFVNQLAPQYAPKTVKNIVSLLMSSISMYSTRRFNITLPQKIEPERHIPTDTDIKNLLSIADPKMQLAIYLGSQGLRRGELCALKYRDVLYDFHAIYINATLVLDNDNNWVYKPFPKTLKSTRQVILPKELFNLIGEGEPDDFILGLKPNMVSDRFIDLKKKLGLQCRFHDLRHYSVSIMHALGLPDAYIMEHNGYSSDFVMKSIYRHTLADKVNKYTSITNEYFENNIMQQQMQQLNSKTAKTVG